MWSKQFWIATASQVLLVAASTMLGYVLDPPIDWADDGMHTGVAALTALLLSLVAALSPLGGKGNPMLAYPPNPPVRKGKPHRQVVPPEA